MNVSNWILLWGLTFVFASVLDAAWHLVLFGRRYTAGMRRFARMIDGRMVFNVPAGILAQVMVVTGILFLVFYRGEEISIPGASLVGAAAGMLAISVYGVTSYALFSDWGRDLAVLEFAWGPLLGGLTGAFAAWLKGVLA